MGGLGFRFWGLGFWVSGCVFGVAFGRLRVPDFKGSEANEP